MAQWKKYKGTLVRMTLSLRYNALSLNKHGLVKEVIENIRSNMKLLFLQNSWLSIFYETYIEKKNLLGKKTNMRATAITGKIRGGVTVYRPVEK